MDTEALRLLIQGGETSTVEFKVAPPRSAELAERICGFANSLGGIIIIGVVDKTWEILGVNSTSETIDILLQAARLCKPTMQFEPYMPQIVEIDGKELVLAYIPPNDGTLYQSGGVCWTRRGTHTVPLGVPEIEAFLYHRGTLAWETQPVLQATLEDLDIKLIEGCLEGRSSRNKTSGRLSHLDEILVNFGCAVAVENESKRQIIRPTNAGMLLFGYNPQQFLLQAEVVCVLYLDNLGMRRYADRRILHGTITQQIDQAEVFFKQYIPVAGYMEDFHRRDVPDYPLDALREAVVNAVVHRDYSLRGESVRIFYYPDRIEIHNPGLLLPGITLTELQQGKVRSKLRNPVIGTVLRDFPDGYMERVGSGITYMIDQMRKLGCPEPRFKEQGEIVVTFLKASPPIEDTSRTEHVSSQLPIISSTRRDTRASSTELDFAREERQKLALRFVHEHGSIANKEYRTATGVSESTARRDLEKLVERGSLRAFGDKRTRRYKLP